MFASRLTLTIALSMGMTAAALAQPSAPVVVVNLQSYSYSPTTIRLAAGKPVTLQFVNRSGKGHDFTARQFFASAKLLSGRVEDGEVDLGGGKSASVTLVPAAGTYAVHCSRAFHKALGMHSVIVVH